MTEEEKREHALRIAEEILEAADFYYVYEDYELENVSDDDQEDIYGLIRELKVVFDD